MAFDVLEIPTKSLFGLPFLVLALCSVISKLSCITAGQYVSGLFDFGGVRYSHGPQNFSPFASYFVNLVVEHYVFAKKGFLIHYRVRIISDCKVKLK